MFQGHCIIAQLQKSLMVYATAQNNIDMAAYVVYMYASEKVQAGVLCNQTQAAIILNSHYNNFLDPKGLKFYFSLSKSHKAHF